MRHFRRCDPVDLTGWRPPPDPRDGATLANWVSIGALVLGCVLLVVVALAANGQVPW